MEVQLDPHSEMLMQQYHELLPTLEKLAKDSKEITYASFE